MHATTPAGTTPFYGATKAQVDAQNAAIADRTGGTKPIQMVPYKPKAGQQFWCRELDGGYTLRTMRECMEDLQPGRWEKSEAGYAYFIREKK